MMECAHGAIQYCGQEECRRAVRRALFDCWATRDMEYQFDESEEDCEDDGLASP